MQRAKVKKVNFFVNDNCS